jgi:hypothetical protein
VLIVDEMADIQKEAIAEAYEDVRNDSTPTSWALLTYDNNTIVLGGTGSDYEEFRSKFTDDERLFGFVRLTSGDELSKRAKFVLVSWIGANVGALKKAKMSTDKATVKTILKSFALEIQTSDPAEIEENHLREALIKAGGANYGTGVRE